MASTIYLGVGDGAASDKLDLLDTTKHYVPLGSYAFPPPAAGDRGRVVTLGLTIVGTSTDDLMANRRNIETKLAQARQAVGPFGHGTRVVLSVKLSSSTNYVYFDVVDGRLEIDADHLAGNVQDATLTLVCLPYARGDAVTTTVSGTITATSGTYATPGNTGSGGLFLASIPGDVPALARHKIEDVSTNSHYINRVRVGSFSLPDPASAIAQSDFTPWIDDTPAGAGVAFSDSTAVGSSCSQLSLSSSIQRAASYAKPSATYMTGQFDAWVRVRDSNTLLGPPTLTLASIQNDVNMPRRQTVYAQSTSASSLTPTWSSATKSGSFLALAVMIGSNTSITTPAGWTAGPTVTHGSNTAKVAWFYINAGSASQSGAVTVTLGAAVRCNAVMFEVVGARYAGALDVVPTNTGTGNSLAVTSGALAQSRTMIYTAFYSTQSGSAGRSISSGFTDAAEVYDGGNGFRGLVGQARSTSTTSQTMTGQCSNSGDWAGAMIGVRPQQDTAPSIPTGTYDVCVVAASSGGTYLSEPSSTQSVVVTQTDCVIMAEWTAGTGMASVDHYRIYYRISGGSWEYYAMPAAAPYTAYYVVADAGTVANPPTDGPVASRVYLLGALSSGAQTYFTKATYTQLGASQWEWLYVGVIPLPPMPASDGSAPRDWVAYVDAANDNGTGTLDVDALVLMPHPNPGHDNAHIVTAEYKNLNIAALRRWNLETRRDGATFGYLSQTGGDTEAGQLTVVGDSLIGPGDCWLTTIPDIESGLSDTVNTQYTHQVVYVPRYVYLRGT